MNGVVGGIFSLTRCNYVCTNKSNRNACFGAVAKWPLKCPGGNCDVLLRVKLVNSNP